jgi:hypothetical protein
VLQTLVRPQVEYASTVLDPHTKKSNEKLEQVQRWAARVVTNNYSTTRSVTSMTDGKAWMGKIKPEANESQSHNGVPGKPFLGCYFNAKFC